MDIHQETKPKPSGETEEFPNFIRLLVGNGNKRSVNLAQFNDAVNELMSGLDNYFVLFHARGNSFKAELLNSDPSDPNPDSPGFIKDLFQQQIPDEIGEMLAHVLANRGTDQKVITLTNHMPHPVCLDLLLSWFTKNQVLGVVRNVTGLVEWLSEAHSAKKNLEKFQEHVPIGLFQADPEGKITFVNRWFSRILGSKSPQALVNSRLRDLFSVPEKCDDLIRYIKENGRTRESEVRLNHSRKKAVWGIIKIQAVTDDQGRFENIDGYLYDITERKNALEQLSERELMFKAISQNLDSALYMFDEEGTFIYSNPAMHQITGYDKKEIFQKKFFEVIHPDFTELVKKRGLKRLKGKHVPKSYELKIISRSGEEKWLEVHASRITIKEKPVIIGLANDITQRKLALDEIKSSRERYKTLYSFFRLMADNVPDMIWAKNLNHEYIFVNKALCDQLLMEENVEEPIGKTDAYFKEREQATHPEDPNWFTFGDLGPNSDDIVLNNKRYQTFEEYGTIKGELAWFDVHKAPLVDDAGEIIGTVGSARNVTLQKKLEEERSREEQIKNVVYRISNAIRTTKDLSELYTVIRLELGQVINTTNMYIALYDRRTERLSLPYFVDDNDRYTTIPGKNTLTHHLLKQNKPLLLRETDYYNLASEESIEIVGTPAKVWMGVPLHINEDMSGALVLQNYKDPYAFTDRDLELLEFVSSQISVSINHKQADDALRENEFMLREIVDSIPHMIFAKDRNQRFVLANKAFARACGKQVGEIEGKLQSEIHPHPEEVSKYRHDDELLLKQKSKRIETEEMFTQPDGDKRILHTVKVPLNPDAEKGIAVLGVAMDITEAKTHESELQKAKERAEESDRLKTAFLANMSHEIRTPMNAIIGFSELLNDPELNDATRREFVNLIGENSKVLLNLIEDIIDVAKIEAHQVKIVQTTCQVNAILDELEDLYEKQLPKYPHKDIQIKVSKAVDDEDFLIITDPLRLRQVLNNIIGNAIKFTDRGQVSFGYSIKNDTSLLFFISDTGIGLAEEKKSLIFERFRQVEESSTKEYGGTGLGLTISKRLIEMLGGSIWVESQLNEGSTFYFTIPFRPVKERFETKLFRRQSDKQNWSGKTILVAEDESSNFELIKATLQRTGAHIIRAMNGKEAVALCCDEKQSIDLVLMDIRMPVMNGYEATRLIKAEDKNIPVISLTAYAMSDDREKSFRAGCDEYVSKPFNPADLLDKMSRFLH